MAGGIWAPFKEVVRVVNDAILKKEPNAYYSLDAELKKHKPDFISLLKNPAKNAAHRTMLTKAVRDGLELPNFPNLHTLPQEYIDEALVLSDILNLNEMSAIELLLAGEQQLPHFPSYTRGLVAVLLYHDGRRSIVSALRTLIQAREGVAWTIGLSPAVVGLVTTFTNQLFEEGLVGKLLDLLSSITVEGELAALAKGKGIGGPQHRQEIVELVTEQRTVLADCLLFWVCQTPLPRQETLKVLRCLQKVHVDTPSCPSLPASLPGQAVSREYAVMDHVSLALFLTLLACFNIGDDTAEDAAEGVADEMYPILSDAEYLPSLHMAILKSDGWTTPELCKAVQFAWGVLLREYGCRPAFTDRSEPEDDEELVDEGIKYGAFHFLRRSVVASPHFHREDLYVQRLHKLITSFIVNMHLKVKDLRNLGDEVAKEVMVRGGDMAMVSSERRGFEELMRLIGDLYANDPNDLRLSSEFWPIADTAQSSLHNRTPHRQISLYKFLSTCSNFLPSPLFSAFMHMLTGISSSPITAHHCFTLLKANSPTLGGGGASAAISLEHFFNSLRQYYLGLRNGGGARAPPTGCAISPQEVQGLKDVLTIIGTIAKQDESARVVMYENQSWLPVASLFGLIGCPIPRDLKAKVLHTLSTFALSPEIAGSMWHTLEVAQVLNTAHTPGMEGRGGVAGVVFGHHVTQEGNLQVELEEIESQAEEYPLTRAFLELLLVLIKVPIPPTLGVGRRVRGFQPYLKFVRDAVFLKFDSRAYRDRNEKWEVARLALSIMYQLFDSHTMSSEDFTDQQYQLPEGGVVTISKPPGHELLEHMLNDSLLLKKILSVVDEALLVLSTHAPTPPPEGVAHAALLCLQLLGATLEREAEFMDLVRKTKEQLISVHPLHHLLLGVNPRSGKADHMLNIARYVGLTRCSPELALAAVQVLHGVAQTPKAGKDMITTMMDKDVYPIIMHGFVEHFEVEVTPPDQEASADPMDTQDGVHRAIQVQILKLLSGCIDMPAPNIAHLLLGFESGSGKHISETILQDPGVSGSPRTCLHSILALVGHTPLGGCHYMHPALAELCYKVLYQLCSHHDLSVPTLRYLRNNHDFLHTQLARLPLDATQLPETSDSTPSPAHVSLMHQEVWLLRSSAIELRMTLLNHLRSHTQRLLNLLLSEPNNGNGGVAQLGAGQERAGFELVQEGRRKILVLLDMVSFQEHALPSLDLEYFDPSAVEGAIKSCEVKDGVSGAVSCDVKELHKVLMLELNTAQGPSLAGHYQGILEEVHKVLSVVVRRNQIEAAAHLSRELFESWRQLVETTLHAMLQDSFKRELKVAVLFELIQDLLLKVGQCESPALTTSVHGVILILLSHLRQAVLTSSPLSEEEDSLLSSLYSGPLLAIMSGLVENVLKAPAGMQQVRAYLYGSLLYYLSMTHSKEEEGEGRSKGSHGLWKPGSELSAVATANLTTLNSFGEPFMETVCKNACSGHDVARMLSLSVLDAVLSLDWQSTWLKFMTQHGYLQTLCASLQWEDANLKKMLHPMPEALCDLYIYESKMAFLTQVANNPLGARELTSINALSYLSQCKFIDLRPSNQGNHRTTSQHSQGFIPSVSDRYRQLLFPILKLLLGLLTCPGSHHNELSSQVTSLIGSHSDIFAAILKEQQGAVVTMATLQELALVTAVIGNSGVGNDWGVESATPFGSGLMRLQRLMLTLLPRYWSKQSWQKLVDLALQEAEEEGEGDAGGEGREGNAGNTALRNEAFLLVQQISANIVSYCWVAMTMGGKEFSSPYCRVLLTPDLSEALSIPPNQDPFSSPSSSPSNTRPPSLGLLIQHLKECTEGFVMAFESYQHYSKKKSSHSPLSSEDIRQLLPRSVLVEKVGLSQQQALARKYLKTRVANMRRKLKQYVYVVENLLFLLWRHLQYYLLHCIPVDPEPNLLLQDIGRAPMRRLQGGISFSDDNTSFDPTTLSEGVRSHDLEQLKFNSVKCLTDSLFKKLLDLEEAQMQLVEVRGVEFVQALVRRIKRLLKLKGVYQPLK